MNTKKSDSSQGSNISKLPYFATWRQKGLKDQDIPKQMMNYYLDYHGMDDGTSGVQQKLLDNYDIYSGQWKSIENYKPKLSFNVGNENVQLKGDAIKYYPYADQILRAIVSEVALLPFKPMVHDVSASGAKLRKRIKTENVAQWLKETIVEPERQRLSQKYMQEYGIQDPSSLNPEQQKQMQADIQSRIQDDTELLQHYMNSSKLPVESMAQVFVRDMVVEQDMRNKFIDGFRDMILSGSQFHRVWAPNGKLLHEDLNPLYVKHGGSDDTKFVEDGEYASYEQYIQLPSILSKYFVDKKTAKKLRDKYDPNLGNTDNRDAFANDDIERRMLYGALRGEYDQTQINYKTREGQAKMQKLYAHYDKTRQIGDGRRFSGIQETYVTWRWNRKMKRITRIENDRKKMYYVDEHYESSALKGDIEVDEFYAPQVWHGVRLGGAGSDVYMNVEPVPYQYNNLENPFDTKLTIYGGKMNRLRNNTDHRTLVDPAKPWIYRHSVLINRLEEFEATDVGRVMLGTASMKPDKWTWQQFFTAMRYGKFVPINLHGEHISPQDASFFKSIDISQASDIAGTLDKLQYTENKIATQLNYNPSKMGISSPYTTSQTNQQNIQASDRKLYEYFRMHNNIVNRVLQAALDVSRVCASEKDIMKSVLLNDHQIAVLETDPMDMKMAALKIRVDTDYDKVERFNQTRQAIVQYVMNGHGDLEDFIEAMDTESMPELKELADRIVMKKRKAEKRQMQSQQALEKEKAEVQKMLQDLKTQSELAIVDRSKQYEMAMKELDVQKFARQFDIDGDKVNDRLTEREMMLEAEAAQKEKDRELERYKIDKRTEVERDKLNRKE
jgi:hypothetical protein